MIFLTGDIHHMSMRGVDQAFMETTEAAAGLRFAETAEKYHLKSTLFVSGRCAEEHRDDIKTIAANPLVEIGGHNYRCFQPLTFFLLYGKVTGLKNGPRFVQDWDVRKTVEVLQEITGTPIVSWRNHGYRGDRNTSHILRRHGIRFRSDYIDLQSLTPFSDGYLQIIPINTLPDHDTIDHGDEIEDYAARRISPLRIFRPAERRILSILDWCDHTLRQCEKVLEAGGMPTILVHPGCMEVIDNFKTLDRFLRSIRENFGDTDFVRDAPT